MAVTFTNSNKVGPMSVGNTIQTHGQLTLIGTYAAGGFTFTPGTAGVSHVHTLFASGNTGRTFWYQATTGKLWAYIAGVEVGGGVDLTGVLVDYVCTGI